MRCPVCKKEDFSLLRIFQPITGRKFYGCLNCHTESGTLKCFNLTPKERATKIPVVGTWFLRGNR